jgi:putative transposase
MAKYQNKYRIESARAQWWDYGWNGAYFITICTHRRKHFFGEIKNKKMILSHLGIVADILWHEIPNHADFVELGDFVVMPNHIHGILILDKPDGGKNAGDDPGDSTDNFVDDSTDNSGDDSLDDPMDDSVGDIIVQTLHATSLPPPPSPPSSSPPPPTSSKNEQMAAISPKSNSISAILRSYKSAVTKHANRLELPNGWQERFHDHIIRDDAEYQRISNYIITNPENWGKDKFNTNK